MRLPADLSFLIERKGRVPSGCAFPYGCLNSCEGMFPSTASRLPYGSSTRSNPDERPLAPVLDQHQVARGLIHLRVEQPLTITRHDHPTKPGWRRFFQREDRSDVLGLEIEQVDHRLAAFVG